MNITIFEPSRLASAADKVRRKNVADLIRAAFVEISALRLEEKDIEVEFKESDGEVVKVTIEKFIIPAGIYISDDVLIPSGVQIHCAHTNDPTAIMRFNNEELWENTPKEKIIRQLLINIKDQLVIIFPQAKVFAVFFVEGEGKTVYNIRILK